MGASDPYLKIVLGGKSPHDAALAMINGTKLDDPEVRRKLIEGGEAAVNASTDTMIAHGAQTRSHAPRLCEVDGR